jgi:serine/threonine-protein kinase RsbW
VTAQTFESRERSIPAKFGWLSDARDFAASAAVDFGLDDDGVYAVKLAMSEAVTNAIQHGSAGPDDSVEMSAVADGEGLIIQVRDPGKRPSPEARSGEPSERGRGLEFMRAFVDEVELRPAPGGTVLHFKKRKG